MTRQTEAGNVLFLILIAVALFAALSFAVTQTVNSKSSDASDDQRLIDTSIIMQSALNVKTSVLRMIFKGLTAVELEFNPPSDFGSLTMPQTGVFHPAGGSATYSITNSELMKGNAPAEWRYNLNFEVENMGLSASGSSDGNELIAFLFPVKKTVCEKINQKLGISGMQSYSNAAYITAADENMDNAYILPASEQVLDGQLSNQFSGCFYYTTDDVYVYYQVLLER